MDDFQVFINSLRALEQSHNTAGGAKEEALKPIQGSPKRRGIGSHGYVYITFN